MKHTSKMGWNLGATATTTATATRCRGGAALAWLLLVHGCATPQRVAPAQEPVAVRVESILPTSDGLESAKAVIRLELENPTAQAVRVLGVDYSLQVHGMGSPVRGFAESGTELLARQRVELDFRVTVPLPTDPGSYEAVMTRGLLPASLEGEVAFDDGRRVAFAHAAEIVAPAQPRFVVHEAQVSRDGDGRIEVAFYFRLLNENPFSLTVGGVAYEIFIQGEPVRSEQAMGATLVAGSGQEFELTVPLDSSRFPAFATVLHDGVVRYRVVGRVSMSRLDVPFEHQGEIPLP